MLRQYSTVSDPAPPVSWILTNCFDPYLSILGIDETNFISTGWSGWKGVACCSIQLKWNLFRRCQGWTKQISFQLDGAAGKGSHVAQREREHSNVSLINKKSLCMSVMVNDMTHCYFCRTPCSSLCKIVRSSGDAKSNPRELKRPVTWLGTTWPCPSPRWAVSTSTRPVLHRLNKGRVGVSRVSWIVSHPSMFGWFCLSDGLIRSHAVFKTVASINSIQRASITHNQTWHERIPEKIFEDFTLQWMCAYLSR